MILYKNKFEYKSIRQVNEESGRKYEVDGTLLPSVTTVLSATKSAKDRASLAKWRSNVGAEEADRILQEALTIGDKLHQNMEYYLKEQREPEGPVLVRLMSKILIQKGLSNIDEWWGVEVPLYYDGLYAGTTDAVGIYKGKPCIIDFKNSRKKKKLEWIGDYRCQLAAYALAHNHTHGTDINEGVILMATRDCEFLEFHITGEMFKESVDMWVSRLEQFYDK
jgi:genome maintenance exonuclease 1